MRTVLLVILTLSCFVIAVIELSGVSRNSWFNRCANVEREEARKLPVIESDERMERAHGMRPTTVAFTNGTKYSFGTVSEGEVVRHAFHFKNTGKNPLFIAKTDVSCGCTVPTFPKEPIPPGGTGDIVLQFNSENRPGANQKSLVIHANTEPESITLSFTADVAGRNFLADNPMPAEAQR